MFNILNEKIRQASNRHRISESETPANLEILPEGAFLRLLRLERKRSERSHRRFILMLLRSANLLQEGTEKALVAQIARALSTSIRQTDIAGWYSHGFV